MRTFIRLQTYEVWQLQTTYSAHKRSRRRLVQPSGRGCRFEALQRRRSARGWLRKSAARMWMWLADGKQAWRLINLGSVASGAMCGDRCRTASQASGSALLNMFIDGLKKV